MASFALLMLFSQLLFSAVFISTSTSLVTYNFNQPIQLLRLLKMDPKRQMALIRLYDSSLQRDGRGEKNQADSVLHQQQALQLQQQKVKMADSLLTAKKWDASTMNWPKMIMAYEVKPRAKMLPEEGLDE